MQILKSTKNPNQGIIASLDIENLFTNVPVEQTIDIILNFVYSNKSIPPPPIKPPILKKLLHACTTKVPSYDHNGNIYTQTNGVSMGNPLGPCFANYYMSHVENTIFIQVHKPKIYVRYVDDIFILANNIKEIDTLMTTFEKNSVLNFTYELSQKNNLPFLDVLVEYSNNTFITSLYKKPTSKNSCHLNFKSECPLRYKIAVIKNFLERAHQNSSSRLLFLKELNNVKQTLINNGFPNHLIDQQIRLFLPKVSNNESEHTVKNHIHIYYKNQMHKNYKQDECSLRHIIKKYNIPIDPNKKNQINYLL